MDNTVTEVKEFGNVELKNSTAIANVNWLDYTSDNVYQDLLKVELFKPVLFTFFSKTNPTEKSVLVIKKSYQDYILIMDDFFIAMGFKTVDSIEEYMYMHIGEEFNHNIKDVKYNSNFVTDMSSIGYIRHQLYTS